MTKRFSLLFAAGAVVFSAVACGCDTGAKSGGDSASTNPAPAATSDPGAGAVAARKVTTGAGNKYTDGDIPIGLVVSDSGELRPWGVDCEAGVKLAVDQINQAGGVQGHKIKLLIEDSASKPEQGKSATDKLISEGVLAVMGEVSSGITAAMSVPCFEKGVPNVAVGATKTTLTDIGNTEFRVCYTDALQGPVMANFAYQQLGLRNVGLMTDKKQPYSTGLSDAFRATFTKLGGTIVDEEFYESGQTDFKGQLTNLKAKKPDGIFASGYFTEVGPIARQVKEAGLDVKMFGGDGWDSSQMFETGGQAIIGTYFCNHYNKYEKRPEVQKFLDDWKAAYPSNPVAATTMGALGYDAANVVIDSLKRAKSLDSLAVRDALDNTDNYKGVTGTISLKGNGGNPPKQAIVVEWVAAGNSAEQKFVKSYEPSEVTK